MEKNMQQQLGQLCKDLEIEVKPQEHVLSVMKKVYSRMDNDTLIGALGSASKMRGVILGVLKERGITV